MIYTQMTLEHIGGVKELLDICFEGSAWSVDSIRAQLMNPCSYCAVGIDNDKVAAYLAFEQIADEGSIIEIAVHPEYRRQGIAEKLIRDCIDSRNGLGAVFLEVRESNTAAAELYKKLGFTKLGIRRDYYDEPKENAIIMRKIYENTGDREQL